MEMRGERQKRQNERDTESKKSSGEERAVGGQIGVGWVGDKSRFVGAMIGRHEGKRKRGCLVKMETCTRIL